MNSEESQQRLLDYFTEAAFLFGCERDDDGDPLLDEHGASKQAGYSLLWYFEHYLRRDLDALVAERSRVPRAIDAKLIAVCPSGKAPKSADLALSAADLLRAWT